MVFLIILALWAVPWYLLGAHRERRRHERAVKEATDAITSMAEWRNR